MCVQKAFENLAENWGPLSETMLDGIPCNLTIIIVQFWMLMEVWEVEWSELP